MSTETERSLSQTELTLLEIWSSLLTADRIGVDDNFFELGGDSLVSLRLLSAARKRGLKLTPTDVRTHQTIASQARAADRDRVPQPASPTEDAGATHALLPIQHRFLDWRVGDHDFYNIALLAGTDERLDRVALRAAVVALVSRHDALRCRILSEGGRRLQVLGPVGEQFVLEWHDLREDPNADSSRSAAIDRLHRGLSISAGPTVAVAVFRHGDGDELLVLLHHLFCDALSAAIVAEELSILYGDIAFGRNGTRLLAKPTQYTEHAAAVLGAARSPAVLGAAEQWLSLPWNEVRGIPTRAAEGSLDYPLLRKHVQTVRPEITGRLLDAPGVLGVSAEEALLVALAAASGALTGSDTVHFELCRNGREPMGPEHDVARTVGWMFTVAPYVLRLPRRAGSGVPVELIEQIRRIREIEHTWGALRYLSPRSGPVDAVRELPAADLYLNYHGVEGLEQNWEAPFRPASGETGQYMSDQGEQQYPIKIWGEVSGGVLTLLWFYSPERHDEAVIGELANQVDRALTRLLEQES